MQIKLISIFLLLTVVRTQSLEITASCNFTKFPGRVHEFVKSCNSFCTISKVFNEIERFQLKISEQTEHIEALLFSKNQINLIPDGIDTNFPHLKALIFYKAGLKSISADNFKNLTNLEFLNLNHNEIKVLEKNLFQFNIKLTRIFFVNNKIKTIHRNAFCGPINLSTIDLTNNTEYSHSAVNHDDVKILLTSINSHCFNDTQYTTLSPQPTSVMGGDSKSQSSGKEIKDDNKTDDFKDFFEHIFEGKACPVEIITFANSIILIILIILLVLYFICKRKPIVRSNSIKSLNIDHTTHEEFNVSKLSENPEVPNHSNHNEVEGIDEGLYSDLIVESASKEEQERCLKVDDKVIYAEINKNNI